MAKKKPDEETSVKKGKKEGAPLSRGERAAALIEDINKKMRGKAVLKSASEYNLPYLTKRIPTGLLTLDLELRGGFPAGGISQIIGRRNAGKTMLAWQCIRQLQHFIGEDMMVLWAMTEIPADRSQGRKLGVKIALGADEVRAMNDIRKDRGEPALTKSEIQEMAPQVGTIHELHAMAAEDFYDVILRAVEENTYHLIIIDSIGNALAAAEQENDSVHDKTYGGTSAPNTTFLKKMTNLLTMETEWGGVRDTCILGINQVRDNLKDPHAQYKSPGGNALEHAKLVDIYIESGAALRTEGEAVYTTAGWKNEPLVIGKEVNWKIVKGKAGMHEGGKGKLNFRFDISNVDFLLDTLVAGVTHGIIEQAGTWLSFPNPLVPGEYLLKAQGKDAFIKGLKENLDAMTATGENTIVDYIRDQCYKKLGIDIKYEKWDG